MASINRTAHCSNLLLWIYILARSDSPIVVWSSSGQGGTTRSVVIIHTYIHTYIQRKVTTTRTCGTTYIQNSHAYYTLNGVETLGNKLIHTNFIITQTNTYIHTWLMSSACSCVWVSVFLAFIVRTIPAIKSRSEKPHHTYIHTYTHRSLSYRRQCSGLAPPRSSCSQKKSCPHHPRKPSLLETAATWKKNPTNTYSTYIHTYKQM